MTKLIAVASVATLALGSLASANTLVQSDSGYLAFDATSFTSADNWTAIPDPSDISALSGTAMVFADTGGIDVSTGNVSDGTPSDYLTYTFDFISPGDYYLYLYIDVGFDGGGANDSVYLPSTIDGTADQLSNSLGSGAGGGYQWTILYNSATAASNTPGSGVHEDDLGGGNGVSLYNIDATQGTSGNTVAFTIAGRENDIQIDRIVFAKSGTLTSAELSSLTVSAVPEPSAYALIAGTLMLGATLFRRRF